MAELIQVVTTTEKRETALEIARELVERRVAACVQVEGPVTSTYRWQGKLEVADEWRCTIKSTRAQFAAIAALIAELHPYEVPEIVASSLVEASPEYEKWVKSAVR